jgi:hypothetical protein
MSALLKKTADAFGEFTDTVESIRQKIAPLREELHRLARAPYSREEAAAHWDAQLETLVKRGMAQIDVRPITQPNPKGGAARVRLPSIAPRSGLGADDVIALMIAFCGDGPRKAMATLLDAYYEERDGISAREREERRSDIEKELLDLECIEERLIRDAKSVGLAIRRRPGAEPRAVLATGESLPPL